MSANMTFDVETSTHRPKYRLWLGLYIITKRIYLSREGLNFHRRSDWPEIFVFMGQNMHKMEKAWKNVKPFFEE